MSTQLPFTPDQYPNLICSMDSGVLLIQFNRPKELNALSTDMLSQIAGALVSGDNSDAVKVMVITGNQRAFAAGADIDELARKTGDMVATDPRNQHWAAIRNIKKPLIGAVNGFCLGGGNELAMQCDFLIAGKNAQFGQPEINLAILPGAGGTQRLTQLAGKGRAMRWTLTGEFIDANTALEIGLVTELCEPELTLERTLEVAKQITKKAPNAIDAVKRAIKAASDERLEPGLTIEREQFARVLSTEDKLEGIAAFKEKRAAKYQGK